MPVTRNDLEFPNMTHTFLKGQFNTLQGRLVLWRSVICIYIYICLKYVETSWFTPIWFLFKINSLLSTRWSKECHPMSLRFELWWRVQAIGNPVGLGPGVCITWMEPTECDECASDQVAIGWKQVFAATYKFSVVYAILISVGSSKQVIMFCHYFAMPCLARLFCGWLAVNNAKMSRTCCVQKGALDLGLHRLTIFWQLYRISTKTTPLRK